MSARTTPRRRRRPTTASEPQVCPAEWRPPHRRCVVPPSPGGGGRVLRGRPLAGHYRQRDIDRFGSPSVHSEASASGAALMSPASASGGSVTAAMGLALSGSSGSLSESSTLNLPLCSPLRQGKPQQPMYSRWAFFGGSSSRVTGDGPAIFLAAPWAVARMMPVPPLKLRAVMPLRKALLRKVSRARILLMCTSDVTPSWCKPPSPERRMSRSVAPSISCFWKASQYCSRPSSWR
mmetsp:Transcript_832/g.2160  ORF Transcript_832/g.2160 Transcript_832/m.2160 type:complete len:235 (+) Transcript_832:140-844(+)